MDNFRMKVNRKWYYQQDSSPSKREAQRIARIIRGKGYPARVVPRKRKMKRGRVSTLYFVFSPI